jgi:RluA family pseudouridine synthase
MKKNSLTILFEDSDIVIISKPSGLLSIPDRFKKDEPNVRRILEEKYGRIFVVHRLDRDTSGVMVFARTAAAHRHLSMQFEHHTMEKKYLAIVAGTVPKESIDIDIPLMPNPRVPGTMMPSARGKESHTTVRVLERFRVATYVECLLKTGRQHQCIALLLDIHCLSMPPMDVQRSSDCRRSSAAIVCKKIPKSSQSWREPPCMHTRSVLSTRVRFNHVLLYLIRPRISRHC